MAKSRLMWNLCQVQEDFKNGCKQVRIGWKVDMSLPTDNYK